MITFNNPAVALRKVYFTNDYENPPIALRYQFSNR